MRDEAERRIGHLYPKVQLPDEHGGGEVTVIAWLWARTVKCPNPACGAQMPLVSKWHLSTKQGKAAWVEPVIDRAAKTVRFTVRTEGEPPDGTVNRRGARCIACGTPAPFDHVRAEGKAGRMGAQMMAIVAEGPRGRVYLPPNAEQDAIAAQAKPEWEPTTDLPKQALGFRVQLYGMTRHSDLFTPRQLVALTTLSDLVQEARGHVLRDALAAGLPDDGVPLDVGGLGATAYADAVATYLAIAVDRAADRGSTICSWDTGYVKIRNTFARQAIPMTWDFAEGNPFSDSSGSFDGAIDWVAKVLEHLPPQPYSTAKQEDAMLLKPDTKGIVFATDPPYYDNIGYSDLSDFFYVWLRRSLGAVYPKLFEAPLTPKENELIASPYRFGGDKRKAQQFFIDGLGKAFGSMRNTHNPDYPFVAFYAYKQAETDEQQNGAALSSTGWETMLEGLIQAGFTINGTWPMRSELSNRMLASGTNALASSIVLVCRPRPQDAPTASRREFLNGLKRELPEALRLLQHGNIAPVDLAQAAIGPGMAVFSRYAGVLESDGKPMRVRTALQLINQTLDDVLAEQEGEYDADTRWAPA
jgi:putative DNA methylase